MGIKPLQVSAGLFSQHKPPSLLISTHSNSPRNKAALPQVVLLVQECGYCCEQGWVEKPPLELTAHESREQGIHNKEEGFLLFHLLCICLIQQLLEKKKSAIKYYQ